MLEQNAERRIYQAIISRVPHLVALDREESGIEKVKAILADVSCTCLSLLVLLIKFIPDQSWCSGSTVK